VTERVVSLLRVAPTVGQWVGRFRLQRELGQGGMADVWLAMHAVTNKLVAVKILRGHLARDPESRTRFVQEACAAATVRHVNVVDVHDVLELEDGTPAMVMEYLEGETLEKRLEHQGAFFLHDLVAMMVPVCSALAAAHAAGIVHRDLKPANIFLARRPPGSDSAGPLLKVLDFGLAKVAANPRVTKPGRVMGTPSYMAPEQIAGDAELDVRADVWSLGIILYECLAAKRPYDAMNVADMLAAIMRNAIAPLGQIRPDVPPNIIALIHSMLSVDRNERPALRTVQDALNAHRVASSSTAEATIPSVLPPALMERLLSRK